MKLKKVREYQNMAYDAACGDFNEMYAMHYYQQGFTAARELIVLLLNRNTSEDLGAWVATIGDSFQDNHWNEEEK